MEFRELVISPKIKSDPRLLSLVETATQILQESIRRPTAPVSARWDLAKDGEFKVVLELTLEDWAGDVRGVLTLDELNRPERLRLRLMAQYGDLLENRSHKQIDELLAPAGSGDAE